MKARPALYTTELGNLYCDLGKPKLAEPRLGVARAYYESRVERAESHDLERVGLARAYLAVGRMHDLRGEREAKVSCRFSTSPGLMPEALTRMRTSPGSGSGVGSFPTLRTSEAAPCSSYQAALMLSSTLQDQVQDREQALAIGPRLVE